MPQASEQGAVSAGRPSFTGGTASFAFVLQSFTIAQDRALRARRHRHGGGVRRNGGMADTRFQGPRNHDPPSAVRRLLNNRRGVFCRSGTVETHRSAHSTNAGGISSRTIITRKMRSSWSSVAVPARAVSRVV